MKLLQQVVFCLLHIMVFTHAMENVYMIRGDESIKVLSQDDAAYEITRSNHSNTGDDLIFCSLPSFILSDGAVIHRKLRISLSPDTYGRTASLDINGYGALAGQTFYKNINLDYQANFLFAWLLRKYNKEIFPEKPSCVPDDSVLFVDSDAENHFTGYLKESLWRQNGVIYQIIRAYKHGNDRYKAILEMQYMQRRYGKLVLTATQSVPMDNPQAIHDSLKNKYNQTKSCIRSLINV
ncbi:MAG: hypothetical protein WC707_05905 [Candidatus Babeliaceae bacterium]|jgi:hypothetical protein